MTQTTHHSPIPNSLVATAVLAWSDAKFASEQATLLTTDVRYARSTYDGGLANPAGEFYVEPSAQRLDDPGSNTIDGCASNVYDCFTQGPGCNDSTRSGCETVSGCPGDGTTGWGCEPMPETWGSRCNTMNSLCDVSLPSN